MLRKIDDDLWCADSIQRISAGFHLPARMTIVRLADGLWLHSPIAIDDALAAAIDELGPVRHLVAPNCFHHLHLGPASERWPEARVHAPLGLRSKREDLRIDADLTDRYATWSPAIEVIEIAGGPALSEFVFVHRPSATVIVCDLVFNMHEAQGVMTKLILRMVGAWQRVAQSKMWRRVIKDRAAASRSCARVLEHPCARVIMSHGEILEGADTHEQLRGALTWMLAEAA
ncbi:DUF4336 domain-containing protein [Enhygromyxa salina]|nr:DUF4336 domain-containing protein [Enhygromyxa salina]